MSDYLYNILVRSFGLIETAQPRLSSVFEPSSDFRPIDALENSAPKEDRSPAFGEAERVSPASSARPQRTEPSQIKQPAARDHSPATADASSSSARSSMEDSAAGYTGPRRDAHTKPVEAVHDVGAPLMQVTLPAKSQSEATPAAVAQASRQEETQPHARRRPAPPASIIKEETTSKRAAHDATVAGTAQPGERATIEPLGRAEENLSVASPDKQSQAKAGMLDEMRRPQRIEERTRLVERVIEQRIVGGSVSKESPPSSLKKDSSSAGQQPHSSSQRMKVAASETVAAFAVPPQQADASILPVVTERNDEERRETIIAQPQVSRYVEMQRPESLQKTRAPEPEQIVQVTIGRVEVRASSTPAAQGKTQPKAVRQPSQSLEEYLRRRGQGGEGGGGR
jgi:hypothetical protein